MGGAVVKQATRRSADRGSRLVSDAEALCLEEILGDSDLHTLCNLMLRSETSRQDEQG